MPRQLLPIRNLIDLGTGVLIRPTPAGTSCQGGVALGGATAAMLQGLLVLAACLIAGFRPEHCGSAAGVAMDGADRHRVQFARHGNRQPLTGLTVLAVFAVVFVIFGAWSFSRIEL